MLILGPVIFTRGHHAYLIPPILFIVVDKMYLDFSVTRRDACLADRTKGFKSIDVLDLIQLQELSILAVDVSIISIKQNCLLMVTRNIHPKINLHCIPLMLSLGNLEEAVNLLRVIHIAEDLLKSRLVDDVIIMCILGKLY